jgi:hypothetical protein
MVSLRDKRTSTHRFPRHPMAMLDALAPSDQVTAVRGGRAGFAPNLNCVIGRANWLFCGSDDTAPQTCTFVSLVASCELHKLDPEAYLRDLFRVLPAWPRNRVPSSLRNTGREREREPGSTRPSSRCPSARSPCRLRSPRIRPRRPMLTRVPSLTAREATRCHESTRERRWPTGYTVARRCAAQSTWPRCRIEVSINVRLTSNPALRGSSILRMISSPTSTSLFPDSGRHGGVIHC